MATTCDVFVPMIVTMLAAIGVNIPISTIAPPPPLSFAPPPPALRRRRLLESLSPARPSPPPVWSPPPFDNRIAQVYGGQNSVGNQRKESALKFLPAYD
jgi:hypothetical protein